MNIQELEAALLIAKLAARTPVEFAVEKALVVPNVAKDALVAAQAYSVSLEDAIRVIDGNIQGMFTAHNARLEAAKLNIDKLNAEYLVAENDAEQLEANINSAINAYSMLALANPSANNARYDSLKKERNQAVQALASHLTVVAALAAI